MIHRADERYGDPQWGVIGLDKSWTTMQRLLSDPQGLGHFAPRPAFRLVAGNVTYPHGVEEGYAPYIGVIDVATVPEVARDLALISASDVRVCEEAWEPSGYPAGLDHFLPVALRFAAHVAARGNSIIYVIR